MSKQKGFFDKYFRVLLLSIILIGVLYLIIRNVSAFGNVLLVLLGFGTVVLLHEFGHFIVAKSTGIKVEAFSIFMPPTVLGVQKTDDGFRFRILPEIFPKEDDESGEGALSFTVGGKGKASETEYRIGLIPFGGFVKLLGQEDVGSDKATDDPRSFANKPIHTRAAVLAAGVVFNVISAVIIFMIVFLIGINLTPAVVGEVIPNSPAAHAGLKAGDEIIEIAGKNDDLDFSNIGIAAALSARDEKIVMKVRHTNGSEEELALVAEELPGEPMRTFGILIPESLNVGKLSKDDANDLHSRTGLLADDRIRFVNAKPVATRWELSQIIEDALVPQVTLSVERTGEKGKTELVESQVRLNLSPTDNRDIEFESELNHIYSIVPRLQITAVSNKLDPTAGDTDSSLRNGDIILAIGDVENPTYKQMRDTTIEHEDKELSVKVSRTGSEGAEHDLTVTVVPKRPDGGDRVVIGIFVQLDAEHPVIAKTITTDVGPMKLDIPSGATITAVDGVAVSNFYDIIREIRRYGSERPERITIDWRLDEETAGNVALNVSASEEFITVKSILAESIPFWDLKKTYKASGPVDAVRMGYRRTIMFVAQTYVTLKRLVSGLVSPKNLMGPVGIITVSYRIVAEQPFIYYVYFLGLISAVIAVFNFLPLPPLDGGLVVLLLVEKVKGSALSERFQMIVAYTGWTLIGTLILYVTFNDIVRSFFS
ncbi:MAG: site-2 protease family protein [Planctomycetota bacterium]|jgi:regulator of sigma E protease